MTCKNLENILIKVFCNLDISFLKEVDENSHFSYNDKEEFIEEIMQVLNIIKEKGIEGLKVQSSKCKYCYPTSNAFSFSDSLTGNFVIKYVIHQESENNFRVEECRNKPIPNDKDGMPF